MSSFHRTQKNTHSLAAPTHRHHGQRGSSFTEHYALDEPESDFDFDGEEASGDRTHWNLDLDHPSYLHHSYSANMNRDGFDGLLDSMDSAGDFDWAFDETPESEGEPASPSDTTAPF